MKNTLRAKLIAVASVLGLGISLALSSIAYAADLTYSADTTVSLSSPAIDYTIKSNSKATSVLVNLHNLTVTLPTNSSFTITSATRDVTTTGQTVNAAVNTTCSSSNVATVTVSSTSVVETVVFTPTASACVYSSGGGGGGGGGGGAAATTTPATSTPTTTNGTVNSTPEAGGNTRLSSANIVVGVSSAGGTSIIGSPYQISATSGSGSVTNFNSAVTLTFTYTDGQLPAGANAADLVVMYFNTATNAWVVLPTTVNASTHTITTSTTHFTVFAVVVKPGGSGTVGAHSNGTLVLDGSTVYLIQNGQRAGFRNANEYASHGYKFGQTVAANASDKALPEGAIVKALEGTLVLDSADNKTVYMVGTGATKRGFTSSDVFEALGYTFTGLLKINLSDYLSGSPIGDANLAHPDGALVKDGATIWWIRGTQKIGFESMAVYNTYGFSLSKVVPANAADKALPEGAIVKFRDGTLVNDGGTYYLVSDGKKLSFASATDLTAKGYKTSNTISVSLSAYTSGGSVQ